MSPRRLYIHIPWCRTICPYCAFDVQRYDSARSEQWIQHADLLRADLQRWDALFPSREPWSSVYIGGGTPSLAPPQFWDRLMSDIGNLSDDAEVTIEANPEDINPQLLNCWSNAGVNRLSIGVQTFDTAFAKHLGRARAGREIEAALTIAAQADFQLSCDLIYGAPHNGTAILRQDIDRLYAIAPAGISAYALTLEDNTPFGKAAQARGPSQFVADDDHLADAYLMLLAVEGYEAYEVSSFSQPGYRARHNSAYWRREPYIGIGPSAHSMVITEAGQFRTANPSLTSWQRECQDQLNLGQPLTAADILDEQIMLGLRSYIGIPFNVLSDNQRQLALSWCSQGLADETGDTITLRPESWLLADELAYRLSTV